MGTPRKHNGQVDSQQDRHAEDAQSVRFASSRAAGPRESASPRASRRASPDDDDGRDGPLANQLTTLVATRVRQDPYATLGVAMGIGVLVGGSMWRLVARSVLGLGTRVVLGAVAARVASSLIGRNPTFQRQE